MKINQSSESDNSSDSSKSDYNVNDLYKQLNVKKEHIDELWGEASVLFKKKTI